MESLTVFDFLGYWFLACGVIYGFAYVGMAITDWISHYIGWLP